MAYAVDSDGAVLHTWSHSACQPTAEDDPPNYLRGWNHVEVNPDGSLLAIVPLRALLMLNAVVGPSMVVSRSRAS